MEQENKSKKKSLLKRLKERYRLIVYTDKDFEPIYKLNYSQFAMFSSIAGGIVLFIAIIFSVIAFTPIRGIIPGYPNRNLKESLIYNAKLVDSLEFEIQRRDIYFANIQNIIFGKEPIELSHSSDSIVEGEMTNTSNIEYEPTVINTFKEEANRSYKISSEKKINANISSLHFFTPVKGMVTNEFKSDENHFGTDIVASSEEVVKAILPGTVVMASWTLKTGHVIQIQHDNNLLSVYKHNAELLKKMGQFVDAGEPIAIIGNSGELTTGPHLHFELWHNMVAVNPEDYINF